MSPEKPLREVHVLMLESHYEGDDLIGVYTTQKEAQAEADKLNAAEGHFGYYRVSTIELIGGAE